MCSSYFEYYGKSHKHKPFYMCCNSLQYVTFNKIPLLRGCGRVRNCDIVSMFKWWTNWFKSFVLTQRNKTWQETFELMLLVSSSSSLLCMTYSPFKCFQCYRLTYTVYPILKLSFYLLLYFSKLQHPKKVSVSVYAKHSLIWNVTSCKSKLHQHK